MALSVWFSLKCFKPLIHGRHSRVGEVDFRKVSEPLYLQIGLHIHLFTHAFGCFLGLRQSAEVLCSEEDRRSLFTLLVIVRMSHDTQQIKKR